MKTAHAAPAAFSHRHNTDQTFDSICHKCFRTIATERSEAALNPHEQRHSCAAFAHDAIETLYTQRVVTGTAG